MRTREDRSRIAIIGVGFRLPGGSGEEFWQALIENRDLVSTVPAARWAQPALLHPRKSEPGTAYTFSAGSIGDVSGFDAGFFGISPREAEQMDPQQRLLLELTWEAFESAGLRPSSVRGSRCGVYVGLSSIDYAYRRADDLGSIDSTTMTGNAGSIAANRISYLYDLRGPSMTVDTACSSSLVALHQACLSLRTGETDMACVGGVSLLLHPYAFIGFSKASMLSPAGQCRVFDAQAQGYVRSEGGAALLLKPLPQAIADANRILGVIAATGVNNDGRKAGLTVPSASAQAALLREVYERAGIAASEVDYFEAHGTGTAVGDPIEARAIGETLGQQRSADQPLRIGSIKSNLGHLEAAAGMAGLVKALGILRHRRVPANLHLESRSPHIDFGALNLEPVTSVLDLTDKHRLVVGVSAFGFGGTNAHAVLTSFEPQRTAPKPEPAERALEGGSPPPLFLSARSADALRALAGQMADFLATRPDVTDYDVAWSTLYTREIHAQRLAVTAPDRHGTVQALREFAATGGGAGAVTGTYRRGASEPAFVYSGNGSQWLGMGLQLLRDEPAFRDAFLEVEDLYRGVSGRSLLAELEAPPAESRLELTEVAQPALFALQVALTRMLERHGVRPRAVCGHSVGEVAAAWASGALSLQAAVRVIHHRSECQARTRGQGSMTAVELGEAELARLLKSLGLEAALAIAALNSDTAVTVSGPQKHLLRLEAALAQQGIGCKRLALDYPFHSPAMDALREDLLADLQGLEPRDGVIPVYSTVLATGIEGREFTAEYWWRNVRDPVRFAPAIQEMLRAGINTFVEVGPRPVLTGYLTQLTRAAGPGALVWPLLTPSQCGTERVQKSILQLELSGALRDARRYFPRPGRQVVLPNYPWQRERYWHPSTTESLGLLQRVIVHPLLGWALPGESLHWEQHVDPARLEGFADHAVGGSVVFPAAAFVEMAFAAALEWRPGGPAVIEDLEIAAPLLLEAEHSRVLRMSVEPEDGRFLIRSRTLGQDDPWRVHVTGRLMPGATVTSCDALQSPPRDPDLDAETHYARASALGLAYGPAFRRVQAAWREPVGALGRLTGASGLLRGARWRLDPASLDAAFQLLLSWASGGELSQCFLPVRIARAELLAPGAEVAWARVLPQRPRHAAPRSLCADFHLHEHAGAPVALLRGVRFKASSLRRSASSPRWVIEAQVGAPRRDCAAGLPSVQELAQTCAQVMHAPARRAARERYAAEIEPLIDSFCAAVAERAAHALFPDGRLDWDDLAVRRRLEPHRVAALRSLLSILEEEQLTTATEGGSRLQPVAFPEPQAIWTSLIQDYPEYGGRIGGLGARGLALLAALAGGVPEAPDTAPCATRYFWAQDGTAGDSRAPFAAVHALLRSLAAQLPSGERLRILWALPCLPPEELGRGVLPRADIGRCELLLAAPNAAVLEEWRLRHPAALRLETRLLDLEAPDDPDTSAVGRLDVLVLADVSQAPDPAAVLARARTLLLPGGLLVLIDQAPARSEQLWRAAARLSSPGIELRPRYGPAQLQALAAASGYGEVSVVPDAPGTARGPYLLITQAPARPPRAAALEESKAARSWLVAGDGEPEGLAAALAQALRARGQRVIEIATAREYAERDTGAVELDPTSTTHWRRLLAHLGRAGLACDAWIHLTGLTGGGAEPCAQSVQRTAALAAWLQAVHRGGTRTQTVVVGLGSEERERDGASAGADSLTGRLRDAALLGMTRVAQQEHSDCRVRWIGLGELRPAHTWAERLAIELLGADDEDEIVLGAGARYAPRLRASSESGDPESAEPACPTPAGTTAYALEFTHPGSFRNLTWRALPQDAAALAADEVEIEVRAAGMNFRDVMYAMGLLPDEALEDGYCGPHLGMELAGIVRRVGPAVALAPGERVMAIAAGAFASQVRTREFAVARIPDHWSFEAAATVPTAFFTAWYALVHLARLRPGERVLIHGGAGGVGIAAIQVARHLGARVYATAGSPERRAVVRLLGAEHAFDSRSLGFAEAILAQTDGEGVDVVLNSLSGEALRRSLRILRPFGRMVELGKRDFYEDSRIGLRPFRNNIGYFGFDADQLMAHRPQLAREVLRELMQRFEGGDLHPLPHRAFAAADIDVAFRQMQGAQQLGKIVVEFPPQLVPAAPKSAPGTLRLSPAATYLVTGGLSGFGLKSAEWLAARGARHLALLGRRGAATPECTASLDALRAQGVEVLVLACDVADREALGRALDRIASELPPLRGVIHAAMVIEDALLRDLTREQLQRSAAAKLGGAWNLHELTRQLALEFFVLYSSATTLFGNPGQGAYVAANRALEALATERRRLGLPATCLALGPIEDAGYLARNEPIRKALVARIGGRALSTQAALAALEAALLQGRSLAGVLEFDWPALARSLPAARAPKFSELAREAQAARQDAPGASVREELLQLPAEALAPALVELVRAELAHILRTAGDRIAPGTPLAELGMDSLMAVELATAIEARLGVPLSALALGEAPTVERIAARLARQLRPDSNAETAPLTASSGADAEVEAAVRVLAARHASELSSEEVRALREELRAAPDAPLSGLRA